MAKQRLDIEITSKKTGTDALKQTNTELNSMKGSLVGAGKNALAFARDMTILSAGVIQVTKAIVEFSKESIMAFAEDEKATIKLKYALQDTGIEFSKLTEWVSRFQDRTGFADDMVNSLLAFLAVQGRTEEQMKMMITTAAGMVQVVPGINDLETAVRFLDQTLEGNIGRIGRVESELKDLSETQLRNGDAVEYLYKKYGKFTNVIGESTAGKIDIIKAKLGDLNEAFGEGLVEGFTEGLDLQGKTAEETARKLDELKDTVKDVGSTIAEAYANSPFVHILQVIHKIKEGTADAGDVAEGFINIFKVNLPPIGYGLEKVAKWMGIIGDEAVDTTNKTKALVSTISDLVSTVNNMISLSIGYDPSITGMKKEVADIKKEFEGMSESYIKANEIEIRHKRNYLTDLEKKIKDQELALGLRTETKTGSGPSIRSSIDIEKQKSLMELLEEQLLQYENIEKSIEGILKMTEDLSDEEIVYNRLLIQTYDRMNDIIYASTIFNGLTKDEIEMKMISGELTAEQYEFALKALDIQIKISDINKQLVDDEKRKNDLIKQSYYDLQNILVEQSDQVQILEQAQKKLQDLFTNPTMLDTLRKLGELINVINERQNTLINQPLFMENEIIKKYGEEAKEFAKAYVELGENRWDLMTLMTDMFMEGQSVWEVMENSKELFAEYDKKIENYRTKFKAYLIDIKKLTEEEADIEVDKVLSTFIRPNVFEEALKFLSGDKLKTNISDMIQTMIDEITNDLIENTISMFGRAMSYANSIVNTLNLGAETFISKVLRGLQDIYNVVNAIIGMVNAVTTMIELVGTIIGITKLFALPALVSPGPGGAGGAMGVMGNINNGVSSYMSSDKMPNLTVIVNSEVEKTKAVKFLRGSLPMYDKYKAALEY